MPADEDVLSKAQFEAARMLIARLRSEATDELFDLDQLGMTWADPEGLICAVCEDGTTISVGDLLYGAIVLLWSSLSERAEAGDEPVIDVVQRLGLGLALNEPGP